MSTLTAQVEQWFDKLSATAEEPKFFSVFHPLVATSADPITQTLAGQNPCVGGTTAAKEINDGNKIKTNPTAQALLNSPANAVSTVLGICQESSDYNPLDPSAINNSAKFLKYTNLVGSFPLFILKQAKNQDFHYKEDNYDSLINQVAALYDGLNSGSISQVKESMVNLAKACSSRVNTKNTQTLFSQSTIQINEREIILFISSTSMMMEYDSSSGKGVPKDSYKLDTNVLQAEYIFNVSVFDLAIAEKLIKKLYQSLDDWLKNSTTPPASTSKEVKYCVG